MRVDFSCAIHGIHICHQVFYHRYVVSHRRQNFASRHFSSKQENISFWRQIHFLVKSEICVFFSDLSQFEKDKQHDIRSFLSPGSGTEKKRKRRDDEEPSPSFSSENGSSSGKRVDRGEASCSQADLSDQDFSPRLKRLRTPQPGRGRRRTAAACVAPPVPSMAPRRLSEPRSALEKWGCTACTYSNSGLLPYCEMCEFPRSPSGVHAGRTTTQLLTNLISNWIPLGEKEGKKHNDISIIFASDGEIQSALYFPSCQYQSQQSVDIILLNSITDFTRWRHVIAEDGGRLARV